MQGRVAVVRAGAGDRQEAPSQRGGQTGAPSPGWWDLQFGLTAHSHCNSSLDFTSATGQF